MPVRKGKLKPEDYQRIQMNYKYLVEEIDAKHLTSFLFSNFVLDQDDKRQIDSTVRRSERNELLLEMILNSGPGNSYNLFIEALRQEYEHVAEALVKAVVPSPEELPKSYQWTDNLSEDIKKHVIRDSDASRIAAKLGTNWEILMYRLGVGQIEIERERNQNRNDIICITHLFIKWRQRVVHEATVSKLMSSLIEIEDSGVMTIDWEGLRQIVENIKVS